MNVVKENSELVASLNVYSTLLTCITQLRTGHANNKSCLVVAVDKLQALHGYKTANTLFRTILTIIYNVIAKRKWALLPMEIGR